MREIATITGNVEKKDAKISEVLHVTDYETENTVCFFGPIALELRGKKVKVKIEVV